MENIINEIIAEWRGKTISSKEHFEDELKLTLQRFVKELNSGRIMYQRGREDMGRELIEEIEKLNLMVEHSFDHKKIIINLIKNHENKD